MARVQPLFELLLVHIRTGSAERSAQPPVEPQPGAYRERTAATIVVEGKQEMHGMNQMGPLLQQPSARPKSLAYHADFAMLQVAQSAMNNSGGPAGSAGAEVMLLQQQRATPAASTLARNGNPIDAAADDHHLKTLAVERWPRFAGEVHSFQSDTSG